MAKKSRQTKLETFPRAWGKAGGPFPVFALNDKQWKEIAQLSGISADAADARQGFDAIIGRYRRFEVNDFVRVPSAKTRGELDALRKNTLALIDRLMRIFENPDAHFAITFTKRGEESTPSLISKR